MYNNPIYNPPISNPQASSNQMLIKNIQVTQDLRDYLLKVGGLESPELSALRALAEDDPQSEMQSTAEQGQLLFFLAKLVNAKNILELGVFLGYGTLAMALALPQDGKLLACDIDATNPNKALPHWKKAGVADKIDLQITPAVEYLESLSDSSSSKFDMAFVDADKGNYQTYYDLIIPMLRPGGILVMDNTLWRGEVSDASINNAQVQNFRELNQKIATDDRVIHCLLPLADGMTLISKK